MLRSPSGPLQEQSPRRRRSTIIQTSQCKQQETSDENSERLCSQPHQAVMCGRKIYDCIGHGSIGTVYEAVCMKTGAKEVVKTVPIQNAGREATILGALPVHPNIITQFHCTASKAHVYMFLQHGGSQNLEQVMSRQLDQRFVVEQAIDLFDEVFKAVVHLHKWGICHLDIKPENVMVSDKDGSLRLTDFGAADYLEDPMRSARGTFGYAAPEVLELKLNASECRADLADCFSMGALLFELCFGLQAMRDLFGWREKSNRELFRNLDRNIARMKEVLSTMEAICENRLKYVGCAWKDHEILLCVLPAMLCPDASTRIRVLDPTLEKSLNSLSAFNCNTLNSEL